MEVCCIDYKHFNSAGGQMCQLLLSHGADPNHANSAVGWTALHYAAYQGHPRVVKIWTEAQCDGIGFVVANSIAC